MDYRLLLNHQNSLFDQHSFFFFPRVLSISEKYILDYQFNVTLGKPTATSPTGTMVPGKPTYTWKAVPTAAWYQLQVLQIDVGIAALGWYSAEDAGCSSGTGTCSAAATEALAAGKYAWSIQAMNNVGPGATG